jgi:choline dehydrogenase-like flavoprotein
VTFTVGANEKALIRHATDTMIRILEAAGATSTRVLDRTAHTLGTCRMSAHPDDGVVDAAGRSHEVDNLWIVDNSTFPSALAANPALTQVALALRSAEHLLAAGADRLGAGGWVSARQRPRRHDLADRERSGHHREMAERLRQVPQNDPSRSEIISL